MPSPLDHSETWIILNKTTKQDSTGSYVTTYTDGAEFDATATVDNSVDAIIAEKTAAYIRMHLQVDKEVPLKMNDYVKRKSDQKTFLIKSDPDANATPEDAGLSFKEFDIVASTPPTK